MTAALFFTALAVASVEDMRKMQIPDLVHLLLLLSGLYEVLIDRQALAPRVLGFLLIGIVMLAVGIFRSGLGGGDIKMGASIGFALGLIDACYALILGFFFAAIFLLFRNALTKQHRPVPLAPFLSIGCLAVHLLYIFR